MELAYSMASLALYDIIIYADDSGSMAFEEGGERISDLKLMVGRVADVATMFDDDGILVRFMNGTIEGNGVRDSAAAAQLISQASNFCNPAELAVPVAVTGLHRFLKVLLSTFGMVDRWNPGFSKVLEEAVHLLYSKAIHKCKTQFTE